MQYVYLDNAATTKPNAECVNLALKEYEEVYFNPSAMYSSARTVKKKIEDVRNAVLSRFGSTYDLIFTSSGTEADNTAVFSFAKRGNVVTTAGEHSAIYNSFMQVKQRGVEIRFAKLNTDGSVNEEDLLSLIDDKTAFVSVVHVNNETGAINDINKLAKLAKQKNKSIIFHSDGVQAFLKIPYKITQEVDLYSISAHKVCALKGLGGLIYKKNLHITPMIYGGGQEKNLRSGTENTFGIFVFGNSVNTYSNVDYNYENAKKLNGFLRSQLDGFVKILSAENASPFVLSLSLPGLKAEIMQRLLESEGVIVGTGSACSAKIGTSRIISNCGLDKKTGEGVLRVSFGFTTTKEEVEVFINAIKKCANKLRMTIR